LSSLTPLLLLLLLLGFLFPVEVLGKGLGHNDGEYQRRFSINFDRLRRHPDLAPGNGLIRACTRVAPVKLLAGVDVNREVGPISLSQPQKIVW